MGLGLETFVTWILRTESLQPLPYETLAFVCQQLTYIRKALECQLRDVIFIQCSKWENLRLNPFFIASYAQNSLFSQGKIFLGCKFEKYNRYLCDI